MLLIIFCIWQNELEKLAVLNFHRRRKLNIDKGGCYISAHDAGHWRSKWYFKYDLWSIMFMTRHYAWWGFYRDIKDKLHKIRYKDIMIEHHLYEKDRLLFWNKKKDTGIMFF